MTKSRTGTTGIKYLLVVHLLAWIASALVGYGLLAVADKPELNSLLGFLAVLSGLPIFYFAPPQLLWNFVITLYERSEAFKNSMQTFGGIMIKTKAWVLLIIMGLIFHQSILDGVGKAGEAYFDFVGSIVSSNPVPEESTSNGPVNLMDIFQAQ